MYAPPFLDGNFDGGWKLLQLILMDQLENGGKE